LQTVNETGATSPTSNINRQNSKSVVKGVTGKMVNKEKRESTWPRYDLNVQGDLLTKTIKLALIELKALGITHAHYWSLPSNPQQQQDRYIMSIEVPIEEFPYQLVEVDVKTKNSSNVEEFELILNIVNNTVKLTAEITIDDLLFDTANEKVLDALSDGVLMKMLNSLEKWYNDQTQDILTEYKDDKSMQTWKLAYPGLILKRQMAHKLHHIIVQREDKERQTEG